MQLHSIDTGYFKLDGGAMFGVVPKSTWNRINPADQSNLCTWAMRCLLIEEGSRLILVDTGIGNKQDDKFFSHYYLHGDHSLEASLFARGFSPADITDVLLTHLHFDHVGGAVKRVDQKLLPAFPNAVYWSNEKHWNHAVIPNAREKASFLRDNIIPIAESGQLKFIDQPAEGNRTQFLPGIDLRFVSGHTESMMLPELSYGGKKVLYAADLLPSRGHIPIPYVMAYDINPLKTLDEKEAVLREYLQPDHILFFEHDPGAECCTLHQTEKGIREKNVFSLDML